MIDRILNKLGISLNEMQQEAFQSIAHGNKDVVVLSPTGSGKTLAYLLPLSQLVDASSRPGVTTIACGSSSLASTN